MLPEPYLSGLLGGLFIGAAGAVYLLGNGRIMGASGIIGGLVDGSGRADWQQRLLFVFALVLTPSAAMLLLGWTPETHITSNVPVLLAAGFLVGFGARLANGCTSGHGVCGISRLSLRSIVSTGLYLLAGGVVVGLFRHVLGVI